MQTVVFAIKHWMDANPNLSRLNSSGFVNIEPKDEAVDKSINFLANLLNLRYFVNSRSLIIAKYWMGKKLWRIVFNTT